MIANPVINRRRGPARRCRTRAHAVDPDVVGTFAKRNPDRAAGSAGAERSRTDAALVRRDRWRRPASSVVIPNERATDRRRIGSSPGRRARTLYTDAAPVAELDYLGNPDLDALHGRAAGIASRESSRLEGPMEGDDGIRAEGTRE